MASTIVIVIVGLTSQTCTETNISSAQSRNRTAPKSKSCFYAWRCIWTEAASFIRDPNPGGWSPGSLSWRDLSLYPFKTKVSPRFQVLHNSTVKEKYSTSFLELNREIWNKHKPITALHFSVPAFKRNGTNGQNCNSHRKHQNRKISKQENKMCLFVFKETSSCSC